MPARHAYSHSASVGNRKISDPSASFNFRMSVCKSCQRIPFAGKLPLPGTWVVDPTSHGLVLTDAFPLGLRDFVLPQVEPLRDRDFMSGDPRRQSRRPVLVIRRTHQKPTRLYPDHLQLCASRKRNRNLLFRHTLPEAALAKRIKSLKIHTPVAIKVKGGIDSIQKPCAKTMKSANSTIPLESKSASRELGHQKLVQTHHTQNGEYQCDRLSSHVSTAPFNCLARNGHRIVGRDSNLGAPLYVVDNPEKTSFLSSLDLSMFHHHTKPGESVGHPSERTGSRPNPRGAVETRSSSHNAAAIRNASSSGSVWTLWDRPAALPNTDRSNPARVPVRFRAYHIGPTGSEKRPLFPAPPEVQRLSSRRPEW